MLNYKEIRKLIGELSDNCLKTRIEGVKLVYLVKLGNENLIRFGWGVV